MSTTTNNNADNNTNTPTKPVITKTKTKEIYRGPPDEDVSEFGGWPAGWIKTVVERQGGDQTKTHGRRDKAWISPDGTKYRSWIQVKKALAVLAGMETESYTVPLANGLVSVDDTQPPTANNDAGNEKHNKDLAEEAGDNRPSKKARCNGKNVFEEAFLEVEFIDGEWIVKQGC